MRAKSTLRLIPVLALTYAAGWFSHRLPEPASGSGSHGPSTLIAAPSSTPGAVSPAATTSPGTGSGVAEISPLTSLEEILGLIGVRDRGDGELAMLPLMDLLPRLIITDAATVRRLLEEIAADTTMDRDEEFFAMVTGGLVFRWMLVQPEDATRFLLQHQEQLGDFSDMAPFLIAWAERSRAGAGERLLSDVPEDDREDLGELLHKQWMMADPAKSLNDPAALDTLSRPDLDSLTARWQATDPVALLAWRASLPPEAHARASADDAILRSLTTPPQDSAAVEARLATLPPDLAARGRLKLLTNDLAEYHHEAEGSGKPPPSPAALAARLEEAAASHELPADELQYTARIISRGFVQDEQFEEAARWSLTLPDTGDVRAETLGKLIPDWIEHDSTAASAWVSQLPPGSLRDNAAGKLTEAIRSEDPQNALVWATSISDPQARQQAVTGVYHQWFENDPAAASHAVQSLSPAEMEALKQEKQPSSPGDRQTISVNAIDALIEGMDNLSRSRSQTPP